MNKEKIYNNFHASDVYPHPFPNPLSLNNTLDNIGFLIKSRMLVDDRGLLIPYLANMTVTKNNSKSDETKRESDKSYDCRETFYYF